ncbi:hypothetical protein [Aquimarina algicola]|nr:hypothetical protein [Aquimarina algicola]
MIVEQQMQVNIIRYYSMSILIILYIVLSACKPIYNLKSNTSTNVSDQSATVNPNDFSQHKSDSIQLKNGYVAILKNKKLSIHHPKSGISFSNNQIIRLQDETGNCFSEGFMKIFSKDMDIVLEQQICSSKFIINEATTLKINTSTPSIFLNKIVYTKTAKNNPDSIIKPKVFDQKDFGQIPLKKINLDSLYMLLNNK